MTNNGFKSGVINNLNYFRTDVKMAGVGEGRLARTVSAVTKCSGAPAQPRREEFL